MAQELSALNQSSFSQGGTPLAKNKKYKIKKE
jgi:hypothetical protein